MIVDNIQNLLKYESSFPYAKEAYDFIVNYKNNPLPIGTYEIDGKNCFAFVQEYEPSDENSKGYESHNDYIDLQFVISGKEKMFWSTLDKLQVTEDFKEGSDFALYDGKEGCPLVISENEFAIFFPSDGHKPGCKYENYDKVKKIVVKIKA
ncbi:MAG: YhcH/YjgK/YiaL family protein [Oscillospiraceae bacterium]